MRDDTEALRKLDEEISKENFICAEKIAREIGRPEGEIKELRQKAIKRFIIDFRNPQGAMELIKEYYFTQDEINKFLKELLKEAEDRNLIEKRQYDIKTMRYLTLREWIEEYFKK